MEIKPIGKNEISFPIREIKRDMVYDPSKEEIVPKWTMSKYGTHVDVFVPSNKPKGEIEETGLSEEEMNKCSEIAQVLLNNYGNQDGKVRYMIFKKI